MGYASRTTPNCAGQPEIETDVEWEGQSDILKTQPKQDVSSTPTPQAASDTDRRTSSAPSCMSMASII
ncbi:hypothetical protein N7471_013799 [Penicillium samsonianum]|uniref:uncharacterized protein n=1 Tax=Penicillium samsonianum TaxID=1882272 RepID=UPI0025481922|nr:uncharacterized protein N7471_013799 [Penicillium samsonianum]KAJ6118332.1 hypothetical protein N7471_013799 [Penicillium samsonianum]